MDITEKEIIISLGRAMDDCDDDRADELHKRLMDYRAEMGKR